MLEVEAKVELLAPEALRDRLREAGATPAHIEKHDDVFFSHPQRDFATTDEALRLRKTVDGLFLTYKGPKHGGDIKVRTEHEVPLEGDPTDLLASLGFEPVATLRKIREPWHLDNATVTIDTIDGLGTFAEVEVLADDEDAATEQVETILKGLGLEGATRFDRSYLEMAKEVGAEALDQSE